MSNPMATRYFENLKIMKLLYRSSIDLFFGRPFWLNIINENRDKNEKYYLFKIMFKSSCKNNVEEEKFGIW